MGLLDKAIGLAAESLLNRQQGDGHWLFELEADATIPAEYILLQHYLGRVEPELQQRIAAFLRAGQGEDGGWPLFHGGALDLSSSVKTYFALKAAGDPIDAPHMARARTAILARGGARHCNVFTRIMLALFGEVPWRAVPMMPVEIMLLPRWSPFHITKVSYWSRTVLVPLLVLMARRPRARNPQRLTIRELFAEDPEGVHDWVTGPTKSPLAVGFGLLDRLLRAVEPFLPARSRQRAIDKAVAFVTERLNGEDGLGGIFPAMANSLMMFDCLGYSPDHRGLSNRCGGDRQAARARPQTQLLPALPVPGLGYRTRLPCADGGRRSTPRPCDRAGARLDRPESRCSRLPAIGRRCDPVCGPAAGPFNTRTHTTPMSTTPRSPLWRSTVSTASAGARQSAGRRSGSSACRAATAAGARSTPTTPTII